MAVEAACAAPRPGSPECFGPAVQRNRQRSNARCAPSSVLGIFFLSCLLSALVMLACGLEGSAVIPDSSNIPSKHRNVSVNDGVLPSPARVAAISSDENGATRLSQETTRANGNASSEAPVEVEKGATKKSGLPSSEPTRTSPEAGTSAADTADGNTSPVTDAGATALAKDVVSNPPRDQVSAIGTAVVATLPAAQSAAVGPVTEAAPDRAADLGASMALVDNKPDDPDATEPPSRVEGTVERSNIPISASALSTMTDMPVATAPAADSATDLGYTEDGRLDESTISAAPKDSADGIRQELVEGDLAGTHEVDPGPDPALFEDFESWVTAAGLAFSKENHQHWKEARLNRARSLKPTTTRGAGETGASTPDASAQLEEAAWASTPSTDAVLDAELQSNANFVTWTRFVNKPVSAKSFELYQNFIAHNKATTNLPEWSSSQLFEPRSLSSAIDSDTSVYARDGARTVTNPTRNPFLSLSYEEWLQITGREDTSYDYKVFRALQRGDPTPASPTTAFARDTPETTFGDGFLTDRRESIDDTSVSANAAGAARLSDTSATEPKRLTTSTDRLAPYSQWLKSTGQEDTKESRSMYESLLQESESSLQQKLDGHEEAVAGERTAEAHLPDQATPTRPFPPYDDWLELTGFADGYEAFLKYRALAKGGRAKAGSAAGSQPTTGVVRAGDSPTAPIEHAETSPTVVARMAPYKQWLVESNLQDSPLAFDLYLRLMQNAEARKGEAATEPTIRPKMPMTTQPRLSYQVWLRTMARNDDYESYEAYQAYLRALEGSVAIDGTTPDTTDVTATKEHIYQPVDHSGAQTMGQRAGEAAGSGETSTVQKPSSRSPLPAALMYEDWLIMTGRSDTAESSREFTRLKQGFGNNDDEPNLQSNVQQETLRRASSSLPSYGQWIDETGRLPSPENEELYQDLILQGNAPAFKVTADPFSTRKRLRMLGLPTDDASDAQMGRRPADVTYAAWIRATGRMHSPATKAMYHALAAGATIQDAIAAAASAVPANSIVTTARASSAVMADSKVAAEAPSRLSYADWLSRHGLTDSAQQRELFAKINEGSNQRLGDIAQLDQGHDITKMHDESADADRAAQVDGVDVRLDDGAAPADDDSEQAPAKAATDTFGKFEDRDAEVANDVDRGQVHFGDSSDTGNTADEANRPGAVQIPSYHDWLTDMGLTANDETLALYRTTILATQSEHTGATTGVGGSSKSDGEGSFPQMEDDQFQKENVSPENGDGTAVEDEWQTEFRNGNDAQAEPDPPNGPVFEDGTNGLGRSEFGSFGEFPSYQDWKERMAASQSDLSFDAYQKARDLDLEHVNNNANTWRGERPQDNLGADGKAELDEPFKDVDGGIVSQDVNDETDLAGARESETSVNAQPTVAYLQWLKTNGLRATSESYWRWRLQASPKPDGQKPTLAEHATVGLAVAPQADRPKSANEPEIGSAANDGRDSQTDRTLGDTRERSVLKDRDASRDGRSRGVGNHLDTERDDLLEAGVATQELAPTWLLRGTVMGAFFVSAIALFVFRKRLRSIRNLHGYYNGVQTEDLEKGVLAAGMRSHGNSAQRPPPTLENTEDDSEEQPSLAAVTSAPARSSPGGALQASGGASLPAQSPSKPAATRTSDRHDRRTSSRPHATTSAAMRGESKPSGLPPRPAKLGSKLKAPPANNVERATSEQSMRPLSLISASSEAANDSVDAVAVLPVAITSEAVVVSSSGSLSAPMVGFPFTDLPRDEIAGTQPATLVLQSSEDTEDDAWGRTSPIELEGMLSSNRSLDSSNTSLEGHQENVEASSLPEEEDHGDSEDAQQPDHAATDEEISDASSGGRRLSAPQRPRQNVGVPITEADDEADGGWGGDW